MQKKKGSKKSKNQKIFTKIAARDENPKPFGAVLALARNFSVFDLISNHPSKTYSSILKPPLRRRQ